MKEERNQEERSYQLAYRKNVETIKTIRENTAVIEVKKEQIEDMGKYGYRDNTLENL